MKVKLYGTHKTGRTVRILDIMMGQSCTYIKAISTSEIASFIDSMSLEEKSKFTVADLISKAIIYNSIEFIGIYHYQEETQVSETVDIYNVFNPYRKNRNEIWSIECDDIIKEIIGERTEDEKLEMAIDIVFRKVHSIDSSLLEDLRFELSSMGLGEAALTDMDEFDSYFESFNATRLVEITDNSNFDLSDNYFNFDGEVVYSYASVTQFVDFNKHVFKDIIRENLDEENIQKCLLEIYADAFE